MASSGKATRSQAAARARSIQSRTSRALASMAPTVGLICASPTRMRLIALILAYGALLGSFGEDGGVDADQDEDAACHRIDGERLPERHHSQERAGEGLDVHEDGQAGSFHPLQPPVPYQVSQRGDHEAQVERADDGSLGPVWPVP